jgi:membrane-bound serine protease (ClpP class)
LAFFAFQVLPVDTTGLLLIVFGLGLLILELKVPSFGVLGVGGTISLLIGSLMLTNDIPGVRVSYGVIVPVVLGLAAIIMFLGRLAMMAHRQKSVTGAEGLVGEQGATLAEIGPAEPGHIRVHGEIWRAKSPTGLAAGTIVRVTAVEGLTLIVVPADLPATEGETP